MDFTYKGKIIMPTKDAMDEMSEINIDLYDVQGILKDGFEVRKRKKNVTEKGIQKGNKVINVVVVDMGIYYKLIHTGKFTLTNKFKKIIRKVKK